MAKEKKLVESITSREKDFAQWYTDVVREAKLCDYSGVMRSGRRSRQIWTNALRILE